MNVLIAGASGFLGRNLLLRAPATWSVTATYRTSPDFESFVAEHCRRGQVHAVQCDLELTDNVEKLGRSGRQFDLCIFLAANTNVTLSAKEPAADLRANTITVLNVLTSISVNRFIFLSSGAVYDGIEGFVGPETPVAPSLPYAISKLAAELYTRRSYADGRIGGYTIIRFFGAYGPYEPPRKIYSRLVDELGVKQRTSFEIYGDGLNLIDGMYVDDAVDALLKVCADPRPAVTVDLARGDPIPVRELVSRAATHFLGRDIVVRTVGVALEAIHFRAKTQVFDELYNFECGVSLEEGLDRMLKHRVRGAHVG